MPISKDRIHVFSKKETRNTLLAGVFEFEYTTQESKMLVAGRVNDTTCEVEMGDQRGSAADYYELSQLFAEIAKELDRTPPREG